MASLIGSGGGVADFFPKKCPFEKPPMGYVACNGDKIDPVTQPILFSIYGVALPDMRGLVVRGLDDGKGHDKGRKVLTFQQGCLEKHNHAISSFDYGEKIAENFNLGRKWTSSGGQHQHTTNADSRGGNAGGSFRIMGTTWGGNGRVTTSPSGNHNHYIDLGTHDHRVMIGSHSHNISDYGSEVETRMMNIAFLYVVKNG